MHGVLLGYSLLFMLSDVCCLRVVYLGCRGGWMLMMVFVIVGGVRFRIRCRLGVVLTLIPDLGCVV